MKSIFVCFEKIVPVSAILVSIATLTPFFGERLPFEAIMWIHIWSFLILGIFFELPELGLNLWCLRVGSRQRRLKQNFLFLKKILWIRYFLTHYVGPCSGIWVVASGIGLIGAAGRSLTEGWLFWILVASIVGLYKGMSQHNGYLKNLLRLSMARGSDPQGDHRQISIALTSRFDHIFIFFELPTYLFIFLTAYYKPSWMINPWPQATLVMEQRLHSGASLAVVMVVLGAFLIIPLRWSIKKYSCVSRVLEISGV